MALILGFRDELIRTGEIGRDARGPPRTSHGRHPRDGCSIGVLTRRLAERCATLLAVDIAENALAQARAACAACKNVTIARIRIPGEWPTGRFDMILLSEVLCYLSVDDLMQTSRRAR